MALGTLFGHGATSIAPLKDSGYRPLHRLDYVYARQRVGSRVEVLGSNETVLRLGGRMWPSLVLYPLQLVVSQAHLLDGPIQLGRCSLASRMRAWATQWLLGGLGGGFWVAPQLHVRRIRQSTTGAGNMDSGSYRQAGSWQRERWPQIGLGLSCPTVGGRAYRWWQAHISGQIFLQEWTNGW